MKKVLLIIIVFINCASVYAQITQTPWISHGAVWHYQWGGLGGGNDKIVYESDSLIYGKNCQKLVTYRSYYGQTGPFQPITLLWSDTLPSNYTYNNGDTVFYLNNNSFNVLYNFGTQVGGNWNLGVDTSGALCSKSIVKIDSIGNTPISAINYRHLYLSDSANSSVGIEGKIIEHIGSMNYLFPTGRNCDPQIVVEFLIFSFSCFQDNTMSYKVVSAEECENPFHVGVIDLSVTSNDIRCYPNPVGDKLNVDFLNEKNYIISIINLTGEKIIETTNNGKQTLSLDINFLKSGVYICKFENKGKKILKKIIKK